MKYEKDKKKLNNKEIESVSGGGMTFDKSKVKIVRPVKKIEGIPVPTIRNMSTAMTYAGPRLMDTCWPLRYAKSKNFIKNNEDKESTKEVATSDFENE